MDNRPQLLRDLRDVADLSLRDMARTLAKSSPHLSYTHTSLARYESGSRPVPDGLVHQYETIAAERTGASHLATGELTAILDTLGRADDVDRRQFLTKAAYSAAAALLPLQLITEQPERVAAIENGMRIGTPEVDAMRTVIESLTALDERIGGAGASWTTVATFCSNEITTYLRSNFTSENVRRAMFAVGAEAYYLAGWKSHDAGHENLAQQHYLTAARLAQIADPHGHTAYIQRIICHQAFHSGQGHLMIALADQAARRANGHVEPHTQAMFIITSARAHAAAGNHRQAHAAIRTAEHLITAEPGPLPHWAALWGSPTAQVHNHAAASLRDLGDLAGAEEKSRHALAHWNQTTHPRIWALTAAGVATAQYDQGHIAEAQATWHTILPVLDGINSDRIAKTRAKAQTHLTQT